LIAQTMRQDCLLSNLPEAIPISSESSIVNYY